jgi:hypothetical protein
MTETTIGYAVLQIIPSLKGVSEAIEKQIAGQTVSVTIEPKTDSAKIDKSIKDAVKKKPVEVQLEPKIDKSKIDSAIKDSVNKSKPPEIQVDPKIDPKKLEQTIGDAVKKARDSKLELPQFDTSGLGAKLRGAVVKGLDELNNNPALKDIQEQVGQQVGAAIGQKIGEAIGNSPIGAAARTIADTVQTVTGSLASIKQGDAAGGLNGIADALTRIGQNGASTKLHDIATEVQPLQDKFGSLKTNIEGSTNGLLGLTSNSGKIAGGLSAIAGAAGPLAAAFAALDNLMPGFDQHLQNIMRTGGSFKDWVNTMLPQTNLMDQWVKGWINPGSTPALPNSPTGPNGQPRPGLIPGGGAPPTAGGIPIPGLVPAGPGGGGGAPRPSAGDSGTLGSSWRDGIIGPGTGSTAPQGGVAPAGAYNGPDASGGFPGWVNDIGKRFGLSPSTYGGHQTTDRHEAGFAPNPGHSNRGVDWGGPGTSTSAKQRLADFAQQHPELFEQVIWQNPDTGQTVTIAGGKLVPASYYANDLAGHRDHVHTRFSQGFSLANLPSLDTGTDGPLPEDMIAQLHKGEVVVPANQAQAVQQVLSNPFSFGLKGLGQGVGATKSGSDLSLFGNAAASAVSGQVSSALGSFGIPGAPRWLSGISQFIGGISVGGSGGGGGANPMSAMIPAAASLASTPAAAPNGVHSVSAGQAGGPQTIFNIQTARVEDAFSLAQRREKEKAAAKLEHF